MQIRPMGCLTNAGLLRYVSPVQMVSRRSVNGILRKARVNFGSVVRK